MTVRSQFPVPGQEGWAVHPTRGSNPLHPTRIPLRERESHALGEKILRQASPHMPYTGDVALSDAECGVDLALPEVYAAVETPMAFQLRHRTGSYVGQDIMSDNVNNPSHYTGFKDMFEIEPIEVTRYMTFPAGCAWKYVARHQHKGKPVEDLEKALVYLAWAREDYVLNGYPAVLEGEYQLIKAMAHKHLVPRASGVYSALTHIVFNNFDIATAIVNQELRKIGN